MKDEDRYDAVYATAGYDEPDTDDGHGICPVCNGSGEGLHDGTICWQCKGKGES
jgi:hypothetical protein